MQDILDRMTPPVTFDESDSSDSEDSDEEDLPLPLNMNYNKAEEELVLFETFKHKKYCLTLDATKSTSLRGGKSEKMVGPVLYRGKDLPSGKNLADRICKLGRINLVLFVLPQESCPYVVDYHSMRGSNQSC